MKRVFAVLAIGLALGTLAVAGDWPMGGHDPRRSSAIPEEITSPLSLAWEHSSLWDVEEIVAAGDTVVVAGSGRLVAVDLETGEERWRFQVPGVGGSFRSCPAIWEGLVLVGGQLSDTLRALDLRTGELRWARPGFGNLYTDLCVSGHLVLVGDPEGLFALDPATGKAVWRVAIPMAGSPAAWGELAIGLLWGELAAFSLASGEEVWRDERAWSGSASDPVVTGDHLALVVPSSQVALWDLLSGWSQGRITLPQRQPTGKPQRPAAAGGRLFVPLGGQESAWLVAVDLQTRRVLWAREVEKPIHTPCVTGGVVYLAVGSSLVALSAETGDVLWQRVFPKQASAAPIAADGAILCAFGHVLYKLVPRG